MSGLADKIRKAAKSNRTQIQTSEESKLLGEFNKLFYEKKNIEEEAKFVRYVMTRGAETEERSGLHLSSLIESDKKFCLRKQVLSLLYKQKQGEQVRIETKRIFEEGNAIHEKWQRLFIRGGFGTTKHMDKTHFQEEYGLQYTPDAEIIIPGFFNDEPTIIEIKSMRSNSYNNAKDHISGEEQANMYACLRKCKHYVMLLENKDTQDVRIAIRKFNKEKASKTIGRLKDIKTAKENLFANKVMVDRHVDCTSCNSKKAESCAMVNACFNVGFGRIRL